MSRTPLARSRNGRRLRRYQDNFDIILVDESHNFRNPQTKRYRALMEMIRGGRPDKRVVLLTATPINNSIWDLYHQLMLITRGDDTWYAGRAPVQNLRETIQAAEDGTGGPGLLDVMLLSPGPSYPTRHPGAAGCWRADGYRGRTAAFP